MAMWKLVLIAIGSLTWFTAALINAKSMFDIIGKNFIEFLFMLVISLVGWPVIFLIEFDPSQE